MRSPGTRPVEGGAEHVTPRPPGGAIARPGVLQRMAGDERVVLVIAPPGYGKSEIARQWAESYDGAASWLPVEHFDDAPLTFWNHFLHAVRSAVPSVDDEPALLLHERGLGDRVFLEALIAQIERGGDRAALVIDDAWRLTDRSIFDALALLVARVGHLVRFVVVSRADPPLPTAAWRSRGWLAEIRERHLRFTDDEARLVAAQFPGLGLSDETARTLNARAEGWPIGLHLALVCLASEPEGEPSESALAGSERLLLDFLVSEVLDRLPPTERDVLLALSVLTWFDSAVCRELLGEAAVGVADDLRRRGLFVTAIEGGGAVRFHALFRELLERELRWRDPVRRVELHRRASEILGARGDRIGASAHLVAIPDATAATRLVMPVSLELVDQGDIAGLARYMTSLPRSLRVDTAAEAFDLAVAWLFSGDEDEAVRWCTTGEALTDPDDVALSIRSHATWAAINMLQGAIGLAAGRVAALERLGGGPAGGVRSDGPIEARFATIAGRVALLDRRCDEARSWIDHAHATPQPTVVARVILPAMTAWVELEAGALERARAIADGACREADRLGVRPHHGALDALMVAAGCRVATGELSEADELVEVARADAAQLGWIAPRVRAGILAAEVARLRADTRTALAVLEDLRATVGTHEARELDAWLTAAEASCLISCGRYRSAADRVARLDDSPQTRLLRARLIVASRASEPIAPLLTGRAAWTTPERSEAALLLAVSEPSHDAGELTEALITGNETGWVSPFLGLGDRAEACLAALDVARIHPALARALWPSTGPGDGRYAELIDPLTPREITLLELLPTHLSYAQIGDQLYLSVNTIKSNLKSIYRKLGVAARADAVEVARAHGLLAVPG